MAKWRVRKWETVRVMSAITVEADSEFEAIAEAQDDELNMKWDGKLEYPETLDDEDEWFASEVEEE